MPRCAWTFLPLCCVFLCLSLSAFAAEAPKAPAPPDIATPAKDFRLLPGFQAERLYAVPKQQQGSWVSMTLDPKGRLIVSDQYGKLYRVTPPALGDHQTPTKVEPLSVNIGAAQGLLCAFDSLYVMVNGGAAQGPGLYRVRDTNGDDQYDEVIRLQAFNNGGEHGPHGLILSPDGKSILVVAGNFTKLPNVSETRVPRPWGEDHLLGRMWDSNGFAKGVLAPGGWIARVDPEGTKWELISMGYRNAYDIALNPEGELFTYDSDMEWDVGLPWYRPTRINHVVSGSDFGWRSGSGKWPAYYVDSLPATIDIGPGSPTGVTFGTGAKFPAKYQQALFACDWSYGQLHAVHLVPKGAGYTATTETFVSAAPLPLTDLVVRPQDGALYFTVGGRKTESALYRVTYTGTESTAAAPVKEDVGTVARAERRKLEALQRRGEPAAIPGIIDTCWPYLSSNDRFLRYAARIAIEHQPVAEWQQRALDEKNPAAVIAATVALARFGDKALAPKLLETLSRTDYAKLSEPDQLDLLRAYQLIFTRMGKPDDAGRAAVLARLDSHYPAATPYLNRELGAVLIYLGAPKAIDRTLALLAAAPTQQEQIWYAFALRNVREGWPTGGREQYYRWFQQATRQRGGHSFKGYVENIRLESLATLTQADRVALKELLNKPVESQAPQSPPRPFVKKWAVDELVAAVEATPNGRDFAKGQAALGAASCLKCHRFRGEGGNVGPDLTVVGRRFSARDLLESIVEPDKMISDQYQATVFDLKDGRTIVGRVANMNNDTLNVMTNMLDPGAFTDVRRGDVEEMRPSTVSMMPGGLIDTFTREEILDLTAYLRSGGEPSDPVFAKPKAAASAAK